MKKLLVAVLWIAGACGGHPQPPPPDPDPRETIVVLVDQIHEWEDELGTAPRKRNGEICVPASVAPTCALPVEPAKQCLTKCDLAELICDNADDICSIAADLDGDRWADAKCDEARAACERGTARCCACEANARRKR